MIKNKLVADIEKALVKMGYKGGGVEVSRTKDAKFGDFSTNIAFKINRELKQTPIESANVLADSLNSLPYVKKLEVKEPGFVNFFVKEEVWQEEVEKVLKEEKDYGSGTLGKGKSARVEFVSANPTGPLHFGNARGGPVGDVLASVLEKSGYKVLREYLHNDVGGQVEKLGETITNVSAGKKLEDQEYKGEYIREIVEKIGEFKTAAEAGKLAVDMMLDEILEDCEKMGIKFDKVFPESSFIEGGKTEEALKKLEKKSVLKEKDGALWFAPNDKFLEDRETVVVKSSGDYTYFANDIAYHNLKFTEGADLVVDVFGSNHHGHVPRLQAAVDALGYDVSKFHVILYQWVRFKKSGKLLKMSKRSGSFITAREVLDEIGKDALRFFILMHDVNSPIDFDLDLARKKTKENPVYYVQYAHARISSILKKAKVKTGVEADFEQLKSEFELDLIKQITRLPELVEEIAESFAVHRLTTYAQELADSFHKFYENCPVLGEDKELEKARLSLVRACQIALYNTLDLLGVSAPEKM